MSKTAVIISGVMRHLVNASSSWLIDADYYLITENKIYKPQAEILEPETTTDIIASTINASSVTFSSINIILNNEMMFTDEQLKKNPELVYHPTIGMAFKWKCAYHLLENIQHIKQYNKILLLRPDLYLKYTTTLKNFAKQLPAPNHCHGIGPLNVDVNSGYFSMGDTCLMADWEMFKVLSGFFDYYVQFYDDTILHKYDVHSLLARYLIERGVTIDNLLSEYLEYIILRDNTNNMFSNGMIGQQYSFRDLRNKQYEWWKEKTNND